jgi:hypothetical protein
MKQKGTPTSKRAADADELETDEEPVDKPATLSEA